MAIENLTATIRGVDAVAGGVGFAGTPKVKVVTAEVTAAASATSTYDFGNIPSNARILAKSTFYHDDLATTGSPTMDIGLFAVDGNITDDDDALNNGINVTSLGSSVVVSGLENYGKRAWEFVSGQTEDPQGELNVKATLKDADTDTGGTITLELYYTVD